MIGTIDKAWLAKARQNEANDSTVEAWIARRVKRKPVVSTPEAEVARN